MRYLKTADAKSGNILARTIYGNDGRVLVRANTVLTPYIISRLAMLGWPAVYVYDPGETDSMLKMALDEQIRIRAATHLANIDLDKCIYVANEIVQQVAASKDVAVEVNRISSYDLCTWTHSVDVCTYAVMTGLAMRYSDEDLKKLSQAALLHDIGKTMVNLNILNKPSRLTPDEYAMIKNHPEYGYELLKKSASFQPTVCASVYEHHENENGSGYPRGIAGNRIYKFAKIIHAADVYEACTAVRPYKKPMNPADAMENLMSGYGSVFDKHVIDVMRSIIILYPVGRQVKLSDGQIAVIVENRRDALYRPIVKTMGGKTVDLMEKLDITILGIID